MHTAPRTREVSLELDRAKTQLVDMTVGLLSLTVEDRQHRSLVARMVVATIDAAVHELSDGQKQRLCIIAIVAMGPNILLMDEPFSSLDLPTRLDLTDLLLQLPQRVIVASHEFELLAVMDRVIWMSAGAIVADGAPGEIIPAYRRNAELSRKNAAVST